jgi:hypothetical protein
MAEDTQDIGDLIRKLVENNEEVYSLPCKVVKVSEDVAELAPLNGDANIFGVKLIAGTSTTSLLVTPTIDSIVIATFLSKDTAFIGLYSEIDSVAIRGDQYGGLIKIEELVSKLNRLEDKVNAFVSKFNAHTHPYIPALAPAPAAVPTLPTVTPETPIAPTTLRGDLENEQVKHG